MRFRISFLVVVPALLFFCAGCRTAERTMIGISRIQSPVLLATPEVNKPFSQDDLKQAQIDCKTLKPSFQPPPPATNSSKARYDSCSDLMDKPVTVVVCLSGGGARAARMAAFTMASLERRYNSNNLIFAQSHPLAAQIDGWSSVSGGSVYASFVAAQLKVDNGGRTNTFEDLITSRWVRLGTRQLGGVAAFSYLWGYAPVMQLTSDWDTLHLFAHNLAVLQNRNPFIIPAPKACKLGDLPERPRFFFNAVCRETGRPFIFTQSIIHRDISGDPLARLDLNDDPIALWITNSHEETTNHEQELFGHAATLEDLGSPPSRFPLVYAVLASAAFPGVFEPLTLQRFSFDTNAQPIHVRHQWAPWRRDKVTLVDGGIYDNTGVVSALSLLDYLEKGMKKNRGKMVILSVDANKDRPGYQGPSGSSHIPWKLDLPFRGLVPAVETMRNFFRSQQALIQIAIQHRIKQLHNEGILDYYAVRLCDATNVMVSQAGLVKNISNTEGNLEDTTLAQLENIDMFGLIKNIPTDFVLKASEDEKLRRTVESLLDQVPADDKRTVAQGFLESLKPLASPSKER